MLLIFIKFKPKYTVKLNGVEIGETDSKEKIEKKLKEKIENPQAPIIKADIKQKPEFELKFIAKNIETQEKGVEEVIEKNINKTYKFYQIMVLNNAITQVINKDDADNIISGIQKERGFKEISCKSLITKKMEADKFEDAKEKVNKKVQIIQQKRKEEAQRKRKEAEKDRLYYATVRSQYLAKSISPEARQALSRMTFIVPSNRALITCVYGGYYGHRGTDLAATIGAPVKAAATGKVVTVGYDRYGYGKYVEIDHGNGISTLYAHSSQITVSIGMMVSQGQMIARAGMTGRTTGPHVHFEIRVNGRPIPAERYLKASYL